MINRTASQKLKKTMASGEDIKEDLHKMVAMEVWFGPALAWAQHQDCMNTWWPISRWLHKTFINCDCCTANGVKPRWYRKFGKR